MWNHVPIVNRNPIAIIIYRFLKHLAMFFVIKDQEGDKAFLWIIPGAVSLLTVCPENGIFSSALEGKILLSNRIFSE
jgi:hypothetical protein